MLFLTLLYMLSTDLSADLVSISNAKIIAIGKMYQWKC